MNYATRIYHVNQSFSRSHLESPPIDVEPKPFAPFRASRPNDRTYSQLHQLKRKLLRTVLEETPETGSFKRLSRAANQAAELAWATSYPLLIYPCLFDEIVRMREELSQQEQIGDASSCLAPVYADLRFEDIHSVSRGSDSISTGGVSGCVTQTQRVATAPPAGRQNYHLSNYANDSQAIDYLS